MSNYFKSVQTNRTLKRMAPLFMLAMLLVGLPMLGAIATGHPMSLYLEFPPRTRYVQHAPFSWYAFTLIGICALLASGLFVYLYLPCRSETVQIDASRHFPWWGWLAGLCVLCVWALAWSRFEWFEPLQSFTFTPLWISYV